MIAHFFKDDNFDPCFQSIQCTARDKCYSIIHSTIFYNCDNIGRPKLCDKIIAMYAIYCPTLVHSDNNMCECSKPSKGLITILMFKINISPMTPSLKSTTIQTQTYNYQ